MCVLYTMYLRVKKRTEEWEAGGLWVQAQCNSESDISGKVLGQNTNPARKRLLGTDTTDGISKDKVF